MRRPPLIAAVVAIAVLPGCGGDTPRPKPRPRPAAKPARPEDTRCADIATRAQAHALARKLVDRVVAPDGQSERRTIGIIGESLYATCRQPRVPGVAKIGDYRPVKPVLDAVQRDFDEEAINGG